MIFKIWAFLWAWIFFDISAEGSVYYFLGSPLDTVKILKDYQGEHEDFLRQPILPGTQYQNTSLSSGTRQQETVKKTVQEIPIFKERKIKFSLVPIFGRLSRPRLRFSSKKILLGPSERGPNINLKERIKDTQRQLQKNP